MLSYINYIIKDESEICYSISQQSVIYTCVFQDKNPCKQTWFNLTDQN